MIIITIMYIIYWLNAHKSFQTPAIVSGES